MSIYISSYNLWQTPRLVLPVLVNGPKVSFVFPQIQPLMPPSFSSLFSKNIVFLDAERLLKSKELNQTLQRCLKLVNTLFLIPQERLKYMSKKDTDKLLLDFDYIFYSAGLTDDTYKENKFVMRDIVTAFKKSHASILDTTIPLNVLFNSLINILSDKKYEKLNLLYDALLHEIALRDEICGIFNNYQ